MKHGTEWHLSVNVCNDRCSYTCGGRTGHIQLGKQVMILTSPEFILTSPEGKIPKKYTIPEKYTGERGISPPLAWSDVPAQAQSLVLIVDDADAVEPVEDQSGQVISYRPHPDRPWVHWVLYNIPPSVNELSEGVRQLPAGPPRTLEGVNGRRETGYYPPWPPDTNRHHYFFKLYALDLVIPDVERVLRDLGPETVARLGSPSGLSKAVFLTYMEYLRKQRLYAVAHPSRIIAQAELVGTYQGSER
jgi:Raf kinase inhibitor-like YbhB/YbcL family protein